MPSWSENFEWLKYESINFLEGVGSIIIVVFALIFRFILIPIFKRLNSCQCCQRIANKYFAIENVAQDSLGFIHGTFFELIVCSSISMAMLEFSDYFTTSDIVSVVL